MNTITLDDYIKDRFRDDPLYKAIVTRKLDDELFDDCLLFQEFSIEEILHADAPKTVNTKRAAHLLELPPKKEQTLNNYLSKDEFREYVRVYRKGDRGLYRYDFDPLFRFKMILLLAQNGLQPSDIADLIEGTSEALYSSSNTTRIPNTKSENQLLQNDQFLEIMKVMNERVKSLESEAAARAITDLNKDKGIIDFKLNQIIMIKQMNEREVLNLNEQNELLEKDLETAKKPDNKGFFAKLLLGETEDQTEKIELIQRKISTNKSNLQRLNEQLVEYSELADKLKLEKQDLDSKISSLLDSKDDFVNPAKLHGSGNIDGHE